jgi:Ser/Thr protein kinase RdoA (MazF antagonist)
MAELPPLSSLTLVGRARRLRGLALAALGDYDLDVHRIRLISNAWNCVFRLDTDRGPLVLRISLPGHGATASQVRSEAVFLDALDRLSDLDVPAPIPARDGRLVVSATAPGVPEARMCVVFSWVVGAELRTGLTPALARSHGALHARLHDFAAGWTPPSGFQTRDYTHAFHFGADIVLWQADLFGHERLLREALAAADALITLVRARSPLIVTHGDLHARNVLVHRGVLRPIDFEDVMWATRGLDVATSLYYVAHRPDYRELQDGFQAGYEDVAPWPEVEPGEVDRLRFPRAIYLLNLFAADAAERVRDWPALVERMARLARVVVS